MIVRAVVTLEIGKRSVPIAGEEGEEQVIHQIAFFHQDGVCGDGAAIGGESEQLEVSGVLFSNRVGGNVNSGAVGIESLGGVVGDAGLGAEVIPGSEVSIYCGGRVRRTFGLDDIVIGLCAAPIRRCKSSFWALLNGIDAPVASIEVKMHVAVALGGRTHVGLGVADELIPQEGVGHGSTGGPGIVLGAGEIDFGEIGDRRRISWENRVAEFAIPVLVAEIEAEGVFGIGVFQSIAAPDAHAAAGEVVVSNAGGIIDDFHGGFPFPTASGEVCIHIDAGGAIGQGAGGQGKADRGDRLQGTGGGGRAANARIPIVHDARIHAVVQQLAVGADPCGWPSGGCALGNDITEEEVGVRLHPGADGASLHPDRPHHGCLVDPQQGESGGSRIDRWNRGAVGESGAGPVRGVDDGAARSGTGDIEGKGGTINASGHTDRQVQHKSAAGRSSVGFGSGGLIEE